MVTSEAVRVALTSVFAAVCVWYLVILCRVVTRLSRKLAVISVGLHVLMCLAMISMVWPWGSRVPVIALVTVFTAGAAWFAGLALFRVREAGHDLGHAAGRFAGWYQAGMMGAMVWMAVAMSAATAPAGLLAAGAAGPASSGAMSGMSGMSMGASSASSTSSASGTVSTSATLSAFTFAQPAGWVGTVCLALCVVFFAAGAWFAVAALRALAAPDLAGPRTGSTVHDGMGALMAAGMGVALLAMA
ncbi:MAG TPA: DUF5134 domain-containing protein [Streptosporangiaceae bacterium]|nr:DUF5134 domain-containing protein [Streptosporangiaceae bacterium]